MKARRPRAPARPQASGRNEEQRTKGGVLSFSRLSLVGAQVQQQQSSREPPGSQRRGDAHGGESPRPPRGVVPPRDLRGLSRGGVGLTPQEAEEGQTPQKLRLERGKEANDSQFPLESHFFTTNFMNKKIKKNFNEKFEHVEIANFF